LFLRSFVDGLGGPEGESMPLKAEGEGVKNNIQWAHIDIAGSMEVSPLSILLVVTTPFCSLLALVLD
jgi:hypothetical protein